MVHRKANSEESKPISRNRPHPVKWEQAIEDDNIANHLFRLPTALLEKPGLVCASWTEQGVLKHETIWSFRELQVRVKQCIRMLQQGGIEAGDRVLLMVRPGLELITLCFALFRVGAVPIVIDPGMGIGKFKRAVKHSQPKSLVGIPLAHRVSRIFPCSFRSVQSRIVVHPRKFLKKLEALGNEETPSVVKTKGNDLAAVLFTSGSTGAPKGVCYKHSMLDAQIRLLKKALNIQPGEVDLPMLPIFALFNPALGMTTVIPEINPSRPATVNPAKIIAAVERYKVTNSFGSPVLWRKIGDYCDQQGLELKSLKRILVAGAAAPTQLYRQFRSILPNGEMFSPYGATECLPVSLISGTDVLEHTAEKTDLGAGICVGLPLSEVEVRIVENRRESADTVVDLPQGAIGEILVHGPSVTEEYDRLPEATAQAKYIENGKVWHRMGDLGYLDSEDKLWFCGRKVESVSGREGLQYYTEKVEGLYLTHPDVKRCALSAWNDPSVKSGEAMIVLVVQPVEEKWPASPEMREAFAKSLCDHLSSKGVASPVEHFFFMKHFPVDVRHNAKIHRLTLQRLIMKQKPTSVHKISDL